MAAGPPPAAFGGDREFLDDPAQASAAKIQGDLAALNLQLLHVLRGVAHDDDQPLLDGIAEQNRLLMAASDASQVREQNTRELQPVTRVPGANWGANNNIANIRMHNIPAYSGNGADELDIVQWISKVFNLAQSHGLTLNAAINLMIQGSKGGASDYIEQMREEGRTLYQVVQQLEMRYGSLCTPEEARVRTNNMPRKDKESLPEFIDRLRAMAKMACRLERNNNRRLAAIDTLVEGNIRRVLPTSVRMALEERVINRSRMGLPEFTSREIEKEALELEQRRNERKSGSEKQVAAYGKKHNVRQAYVAESDESSAEDSPISSDDEDQGEEGIFLVNEIRRQEQKYIKRGRPIDNAKVQRRAFGKYNDKYRERRGNQGNQFKKPYHQGARLAMLPGPAQQLRGPPNPLDQGPKRNVYELLNLANCSKGQCIQCGYDGHFMKSDACALRDKSLMDKPCVKCGKGLHSADDCLRVYQKNYGAQPQQPQGAAAAHEQAIKN
jgi:hypothetical protein